MDDTDQEEVAILLAAHSLAIHLNNLVAVLSAMLEYLRFRLQTRKRKRITDSSYDRYCIRQLNFRRMIFDSDVTCIENIRMDISTFLKLCNMLQTTGRLAPTKNMDVEGMVAMFLYILSHHAKNRIVKREFVRSGETVSRHFQLVLGSVLRLHEDLFKKPEPVSQNSNDSRWKWFKVNKTF